MSDRVDFYLEHARDIQELPEGWDIYRWERFPKSADADPLYIQLTGAVCEARFTKGPRKGCKNWQKRDPLTERVVILPLEQHKAWKDKWERTNDKCQKCCGTGQEWFGWSALDGTRYRPCRRCHATGKPPLTEATA